jgi:peptidoglycan/LPS O-acetylase OafA/YrhL
MGTIRFLLAIAILCFHTTPLSKNYLSIGEVALETFFIMSGFYMALVLEEKYTRKRDFYLARFLRIYPTYLIILALTVIACVAHGSGEIAPGRTWPIAAYDTWRSQWTSLSATTLGTLFLTNLLLVGQDVVMFLSIDSGGLAWTSNFAAEPLPAWKFLFNPPAWSISLELVFYLIAPFIVRRHTGFLVSLMIGALLLKRALATGFGLAHDPWSYRFLPSEFPLFILGIFGYRFYATNRDRLSTSRFLRGCGAALLCGWVAWIVLYNETNHTYRGTAFLLYSALSIPFVFSLVKRSRVDQFLGDLSYPIYLSHYPIMLVVIQWWDNAGMYVVPLTVAFSVVFQSLVARKIEGYRHRVTNAGRAS